MIMAFLTRQFCSDPAEAITLFHDIWDGTKRREPAQPQRLRWQIRGLGAEPTNKLFAKSSSYYSPGLFSGEHEDGLLKK